MSLYLNQRLNPICLSLYIKNKGKTTNTRDKKKPIREGKKPIE